MVCTMMTAIIFCINDKLLLFATEKQKKYIAQKNIRQISQYSLKHKEKQGSRCQENKYLLCVEIYAILVEENDLFKIIMNDIVL